MKDGMAFDLVVIGGQVVMEDRVERKDIGIRDGKIVEISGSVERLGAQIIDADGLTVMPGMIDAHVHFNEPGLGHWEGFRTGSAALAAGGGTMYFDMPLNGIPPTVTLEALRQKRHCAEGASYTDYAFWGGLMPGYLNELPLLAEAGVIGFKAFMSSPGDEHKDAFRRTDDDTLLEGMKRIAELGKVLALHAEHEPMVAALTAQAMAAGKSGADDYTASRPAEAEVEAVETALRFGELSGCKLHFVHISSEEAAARIMQARRQGLDVTFETCAHYLALTDRDLERLGAVAKCAPPLRSGEEQALLWKCLERGWIDFVTSDHSPCPPELKNHSNMFRAWGGISGVQNTMELLVDEGHLKRGIPLPQIGRLLAEAPARRFGLYPDKGSIRIGADADLALLDLNRSYTLAAGDLLQRHKHSPYLNRTIGCKVKRTLLRGRVIYSEAAGIVGDSAGEEYSGSIFTEADHSL
ncbi:allantoinase AllB [Paenibacillus sp. HN-1]|uniref:allantoinase AllB n=1 Tax=Paenibacillus TaxID=44249 RepID=UPI001CA7F318|nr:MULTISPECIES: allantoinase AllB [Paenibacillus]MBY9079470.1 allantoinase AllB [Paenibacillus sp. CGMCC 1.18879]MBY9085559.1 allantoinase AllB [Paenibacillus sinensis]